MSKYTRYGFTDLVVGSDAELPKYGRITDKSGVVHEFECYWLEDFEEEEEKLVNFIKQEK